MNKLSIPPAETPKSDPERLAEMPLQARSLALLTPLEQDCFRQYRMLLASGGIAAVVEDDIPLAGVAVYEALLARSWEVRFADSEEMIRLAEVARDVALRLDEDLGPRRVAELQARVWGELANAYRTAERFELAEVAFAVAFQFVLLGTVDPWVEARLLELHASLLASQGDYQLAISRLETIEGLFWGLGDCHLAGRALLIRALYAFYDGQAEEALRLNRGGLRLIDRGRDPELFLLGIHNKLLFLVALGQHDRARRELAENRRELVPNDPLKAARLRWVEGRISYGLGEWDRAEEAFQEAKRGLVNAGFRFHGALGALDLAAALMQRGRVPEAEREIAEVRAVLFAERVEPELLQPVVFLQDSFRSRRATADLVEATADRLRRMELELTPKLRPC